MLWRDNERKDKTDIKTETGTEAVTRHTMSREELLASNEDAKKVYDEIMALRKSLESVKQPAAINVSEIIDEKTEDNYAKESAEIIAAEQAIIARAKQDEEKARLESEALRQKQIAQQQEKQRVLEAQKRAAMVAAEAEKKRLEAIEAERKAKEISNKKAIEAMESEMLAKKAEMSHTASKAEMDAFFGESKGTANNDVDTLEQAKQELLIAQKQQNKVLDKISAITEKNTEKLAEEQHVKFQQQQELLQEEQNKLANLLEEQKQAREARQAKAEEAKRAKEQKILAEKLRKEQKALAEKAKKEEKARKKKEEREHKYAEKERIRREKVEAIAKRKAEEAKRIAEAELGGGVVKVHGVDISTTVTKVARFTWRDLLGIASKKEKNAQTEEERARLQQEREHRKHESRKLAVMLRNKRIEEHLNTKVGTKYKAFTAFCEKYKVQLLTAFAVVLVLAVGTAGVFNFCTAYEYSYNGKTLGLVKSKADVIEITDLVQDALTEEKNMDVVVDAQNDIEFKRVPALGNVKIDTSEDVLKRLTYMGDLNIKAYGIYVDGMKVGAVESKEIAAEVMQDIKDKYSSGREGAEIEEAVFIEKVDVKLSNTDLQDLLSEKEMVERLCTSGERESIHTVLAGETLEDIAKLYSMKEEEIIEDNPTINAEKLDAGSNIVIKQTAPVITVRITEVVTYDEKVKFKVKKVKDKEIYEGYSEVTQEGKNGKNEVTARIISVNGDEIEHNRLKETVISKPTTKVIHIGTKERPPTVGSGKYIWPMESRYYTITSEFGARWGRNHNGIDMGCPTGSPVLAADGGTVTRAGYNGSFGNLVVIDHQNGMETYYAHNSSLLVSPGDKVFQGQQIAWSGNTGRSTGPHLHFEIRVGGSPTNPRNYLP